MSSAPGIIPKSTSNANDLSATAQSFSRPHDPAFLKVRMEFAKIHLELASLALAGNLAFPFVVLALDVDYRASRVYQR